MKELTRQEGAKEDGRRRGIKRRQIGKLMRKERFHSTLRSLEILHFGAEMEPNKENEEFLFKDGKDGGNANV